jgi:hypothetical protein
MCLVFVVVEDIPFHQPSQMAFVQHDDVIEQVPVAVANPALGNTVLPRASEAGLFGLDAQRLDCLDYLSIEVRGTVKYQVFR